MNASSVVEVVGGTIASLAALYGLTLPVRRWWQRRCATNIEHQLDHAGRPARYDASTGAEISPAQPGLAAALTEIRHRQVEVVANVQAIREHVTQTTDNTAAIIEIRDNLANLNDKIDRQAVENERRHAENRFANAENRSEIARLETAVTVIGQKADEAVKQSKDAAGHAERIDRQQQDMAREQASANEAFRRRLDEHQVVEQTYVRSLAEFGVQITPGERTGS